MSPFVLPSNLTKSDIVHAIFWGKTFTENIRPCKVRAKFHVYTQRSSCRAVPGYAAWNLCPSDQADQHDQPTPRKRLWKVRLPARNCARRVPTMVVPSGRKYPIPSYMY